MSCYSSKTPFTHYNKQAMEASDCFIAYYGKNEPPSIPTHLRAGPLTMQFEAGSLRYLRLGETEIVHHIYAAVRDQNWQTIASVLSDLHTDIHDDHFEIRFTSTHQAEEIHFVWNGHISGTADGTVTFRFVGEALSSFKRNRIGFCVLHPLAAAGAACEIEQVDGAVINGEFPCAIAPHQPFKNIRALQHEFMSGAWAEVRMEGDTFEMEDQRNWSDASFKTYCTPLELPFPVTIERGARIHQTITVRLLQPPASTFVITRAMTAPMLTFEPRARLSLPTLGLSVASHGQPLSHREIERLRALKLGHLRVDLKAISPASIDSLQRASNEAAAIGAGLEIALHLNDSAEAELQLLKQAVAQLAAPVRRWLIFKQGEKSTRARWLHLARQVLGGDAAIGGGTDAYFTELNRERPEIEAFDFVSYSSNPQVHAFDHASLVETHATLAVMVESARAFCADKPIIVSPLTFKPRWNPNATQAALPTGAMPDAVDARQLSLLGGGWVLGSLKYLIESGAASLTLFETSGWLGVMERETGSALPDQFPSTAGGVFPIYHVLADIAEFAGGDIVTGFASTQPLTIEGIALRRDDRLRLMLANYSSEPQRVTLDGLDAAFALRTLDETNFTQATTAPQHYRAQPSIPVIAHDGGLQLTLLPYALATLDALP